MSVPNGTTAVGQQGSYTQYDSGTANDPSTWMPIVMVPAHGPCPTCGKCRCCDDKGNHWYKAPYYQPQWVVTT